MTIVTETLAEIAFDGKVRSLGASDAARSSFTAHVGNSLIALSPDLNVLGRWPVDPPPPSHRGRHAICLDRWLALISGLGDVRLADGTGRVRWRYPHPPWKGHPNPGARGSTQPDSRTPLSRTRRTVIAWWSVSTSNRVSRWHYRQSGHSQPESR
jgi:hypothetical protein